MYFGNTIAEKICEKLATWAQNTAFCADINETAIFCGKLVKNW
jgi:CRISPR/Cas system-associated endoribonuclease Cas2